MAVETTYARLGLFIVVILIVILATTVLLVKRLKSQAVIDMVTYTTEDVSGLDVSSPVRYRGVFLGRVTALRVDPRGYVIEIHFELFIDRLNTIGANVKAIRQITDIGGMFPKLRVRIVGNPVSGEAYLLLDSPQNPPPPIELGFKPHGTYVPFMHRRLRKSRIGYPNFWIAWKRRFRPSMRSSREYPRASTGPTDSSLISSASCRRVSYQL